VRLSWAKRLKAENRYTEALDLMKAYTWDPAKDPEAFTVLSECLFSENRFQEALDAFNAIPNSVLDKMENRLVKQEIDQLRKPREEYIEFWKKEQELRQKEESADDLPRVLLVTSRGAIVTELFENEAPNTVANFIHLADSGFFNGTKFHRVIPNFMAQGGDPFSKEGATGSPGQGDPGYFIEDEHTRPDHRLHFAGSLSMANTGARNTGGSQFFITVTPTHWLNGKHTVFGRVIQGMDVARSIKKDDLLQSVTVLRRRDHAYIPVTLPSPNAPATQPASTQPQSTTEASATQPSG
jgi:peptidyl-prolyl cis-trans isomerase B (cyclophilin B)